jgi:hypothetical protein
MSASNFMVVMVTSMNMYVADFYVMQNFTILVAELRRSDSGLWEENLRKCLETEIISNI